MTISAPASGKVQNLAYSTGDKVTAGVSAASTATGTSASGVSTGAASSPVLYIVSDQTPIILAQVNEVDIETIQLGQQAKITLPAVRNKTYTGHIIKVDDIGTNTSGVISYNVYISIDSQDSLLKPGLTANVDIQTAHHDNVLTVANEAIKPYKNGKAVQILKNG